MAPSDVKSFYRQRKKAGATGGVTKPPTNKLGRGSAAAQLAALISTRGSHDLKGDCGAAEEEKLRHFDLDMAYGPCLGMTRMERWDRASRMGLDPPHEVEALLRSGSGGVAQECLWDGCV